MARPFKSGLEYFPLDVRTFHDEKLRDLNYSAGPMAEYVYIRILMLIYEQGYYLKVNLDTLAKLLHRELGPQWIKLERISMLIHACLESSLFDKTLAGQGVITSIAVQKQFLISTKRRQNVDTSKYWLLNDAAMDEIEVFLGTSKKSTLKPKKIVNVDNNEVNVRIGTQKENKKKKESDKEDIEDKRAFAIIKTHYITKSIIKNGYIDIYDLEIPKYNDLYETAVRTYGFEITRTVVNYIISHSKKTSTQINHKFYFMKDSLYKNLEMISKKESRGINEPFEEYLKRILLPLDSGDEGCSE